MESESFGCEDPALKDLTQTVKAEKKVTTFDVDPELDAIDCELNTINSEMDAISANLNGDAPKGVKRPADGEKPPKRKKVHGPTMPKNALCQLNEIHPGLKYEFIDQSGKTHSPVFEVFVTVNNQKFHGRGRSKKLAKHAAAEAAMSSFVQFREADVAHKLLCGPMVPPSNLDFTSDDLMLPFDGSQKENDCEIVAEIRPPPKRPSTLIKNPVMILNEMYSSLHYEMVAEIGEPHSKMFIVKVVVEGQTFEGRGSNKKLAKSAAAITALSALHNMNVTLPSSKLSVGQNENLAAVDLPVLGKLPQRLSDGIARMVHDKFVELTVNSPNYSRRKVLAGIVMTSGPDPMNAQVICVTTGTKCINGEHISEFGAAINDCHAEIVARRCLMDFFYGQLELHLDRHAGVDSIFVPDYKNGGFVLRDDIRFHLYINTAPCGDARIFSPHETQEAEVDRHPNRKARGKLRTKIESGEGTIPVKPEESTQTWDGVLQGQRLLTMSCSDKVARWNVLGLQGSLLSHFLPPIYLESLVVGSLFHPQHIYRAVAGRLADSIQGLPPPFILSTPMLNVTSSLEQRQPSKMPTFSLNWTVGMPTFEIINCMTGKGEQGGTSRLAKASFFYRFMNLYGRMPSIVRANLQNRPARYVDAKMQASDYQAAKQELFKAFTRFELGIWVKKPMEQDMFELTSDSEAVGGEQRMWQ